MSWLTGPRPEHVVRTVCSDKASCVAGTELNGASGGLSCTADALEDSAAFALGGAGCFTPTWWLSRSGMAAGEGAGDGKVSGTTGGLCVGVGVPLDSLCARFDTVSVARPAPCAVTWVLEVVPDVS